MTEPNSWYPGCRSLVAGSVPVTYNGFEHNQEKRKGRGRGWVGGGGRSVVIEGDGVRHPIAHGSV